MRTLVRPSTPLSKVSTRAGPGDNHTSVLPDENGPKYADLRQPAISTSRVRGPCTPSTLSSSMSDVADGPEIKVMALPSPSTAWFEAGESFGYEADYLLLAHDAQVVVGE